MASGLQRIRDAIAEPWGTRTPFPAGGAWPMRNQKQRDLLALARDCHPRTLRAMRWANAHLKVVSPQVIAS